MLNEHSNFSFRGAARATSYRPAGTKYTRPRRRPPGAMAREEFRKSQMKCWERILCTWLIDTRRTYKSLEDGYTLNLLDGLKRKKKQRLKFQRNKRVCLHCFISIFTLESDKKSYLTLHGHWSRPRSIIIQCPSLLESAAGGSYTN